MEIRPVVFDVHLPAGFAGPDPMDFDVRSFLVPHADGIAIVDTGLAGSAGTIGIALEGMGATWTDVSDVLLSHEHPDHVGGLQEVTKLAPHAIVWGNAPISGRALEDGTVVRDLRVISTPGHTAGHVSLLHSTGILLVGDLLGSRDGRLDRAPAPFTADAAMAEQSIEKVSRIEATRLLFAHGGEVAEPANQLKALLGR